MSGWLPMLARLPMSGWLPMLARLPMSGWLPMLGRLPILGWLPMLGRLPILGWLPMWRCVAVSGLLALSAMASPALGAGAATVRQQTLPASVEQPRAFGYTVGDLLTQRILLGQPGAPFVLAELPRIGRVGSSLWRRRSEERIDPRGQHVLQIEYQLINTPQALALWYLPRLRLAARDGASALLVPPAPFTVGPFTPPQPYDNPALPALQPDVAPALVDLAPIDRRIRGAAIGTAAVLALWALAAAWYWLRRGRHLPFARAVPAMQRLAATDALAMRRRLHQALNESAGEVVRGSALARLLQARPGLRPEAAALALFLEQSQAVFFAAQPAPASAAVLALARRLRRLERGQQ
jgi:mxaA protein